MSIKSRGDKKKKSKIISYQCFRYELLLYFFDVLSIFPPKINTSILNSRRRYTVDGISRRKIYFLTVSDFYKHEDIFAFRDGFFKFYVTLKGHDVY